MKLIYKRKEDMMEDYNKVSGMLSDQDKRCTVIYDGWKRVVGYLLHYILERGR